MLPLNFDLEKYNYELYEWYNPVFVILCYNELINKYPGQENHSYFKKAKEAMHGAMALLGARKLHDDNVFIMQMNRQFLRPDVIAATYTLKDGCPTIKISPLEITEIEFHTFHHDIAKFLLEKKLKKNYQSEIILICMVNKALGYDIHDVAKRIKSVNKSNPIYIVGKSNNAVSTSFVISSPQPIIAKTGFDLVEQGKNYKFPYRMSLTEDKTNKNFILTPHLAKPIDLFDFFMLDKTRIEKLFGMSKLDVSF